MSVLPTLITSQNFELFQSLFKTLFVFVCMICVLLVIELSNKNETISKLNVRFKEINENALGLYTIDPVSDKDWVYRIDNLHSSSFYICYTNGGRQVKFFPNALYYVEYKYPGINHPIQVAFIGPMTVSEFPKEFNANMYLALNQQVKKGNLSIENLDFNKIPVLMSETKILKAFS